MTHIKITITNNDKKTELEISEADQLDKLLIIQSVFKLFEIDLDSLEFSKSYKQLSNAYESFFNSIQSEEPQAESKQLDTEDIAKKMEDGYKDDEPQDNQFYHSGTKVRDGITVYACHYQCGVCMDRGNHYIPESTEEVKCRSCGTNLKVFPAHPDGFGIRDNFGNWMRAGEFKDWKLWD